MNETTISETAEQNSGSSPLATAARDGKAGLAACTSYLRENPWVGVAGGAVLGAVIVSLVKPPRHEPTPRESLRQLLDDTLAKLPSQKEAGTAVCNLLKKLHIPV
jgi:hypothetical protein